MAMVAWAANSNPIQTLRVSRLDTDGVLPHGVGQCAVHPMKQPRPAQQRCRQRAVEWAQELG